MDIESAVTCPDSTGSLLLFVSHSKPWSWCPALPKELQPHTSRQWSSLGLDFSLPSGCLWRKWPSHYARPQSHILSFGGKLKIIVVMEHRPFHLLLSFNPYQMPLFLAISSNFIQGFLSDPPYPLLFLQLHTDHLGINLLGRNHSRPIMSID